MSNESVPCGVNVSVLASSKAETRIVFPKTESKNLRVEISEERCNEVAHRLREFGLPAPIEPFAGDNEQFDQATANLVLVAICHQTQTLQGEVNGKLIRGWDYLQASLVEAAQSDSGFLSPSSLSQFSEKMLEEVLQCYGQLDREDISRRAAIVRDCGEVLTEAGWENATEIYNRCEHRISGQTPSLLSELSRFEAFQDPVQKKSLYLLGLNQSTCGWRYQDAENLLPPVDYHEIRGHLRLGTVRIRDTDLQSRIERRTAVCETEDVAIRTAVTNAIVLIAERSQLSPMQLHYGFWNLFRNVCVRRVPLCSEYRSGTLPSEYQHLIIDNCCPFVGTCDNAGKNPAIDEYIFNTEWY